MWKRGINRRVHMVWCVAWFCAGVLGGIGVSGIVLGTWLTGADAVLLSIVFLLIAVFKKRMLFLFFALLAGLLFGYWRGAAERTVLHAYDHSFGQTVVLQGMVSEDASYSTQGDQRVRLKTITIAQVSFPGAILATTSHAADIKRGDVIQIKGQLVRGFGTIPAALYRGEIVSILRPTPGDVARRIRDWFAIGVRRAIPEPEASLSLGYLVGQRSSLPETLNNQLTIVGLTHAVVASGYNLTILVGFTRRLLVRFSKYLATLAATAMIMGFVLVTGFSPSMSRAGLVSMLSLIAWYYGRVIHPVVLLVVTAAITAAWRPMYVWGDIGWYLSFTAFAGVIILSPLLRLYFWGKTQGNGLFRQTLLDTMSAQILTMPIILYAFGQYATYALIANVLVLPLVPFAMMFTFAAGVGGLILPKLAHVFGLPAKLILGCNIFVIGFVARLPGSSGEVSFSFKMLCACYAVFVALVVYLWKTTHYNFRQNEKEEHVTLF